MDVQAYLYETNQVVVQYETRMYAKMRETYSREMNERFIFKLNNTASN